jgi:hypothetical protein
MAASFESGFKGFTWIWSEPPDGVQPRKSSGFRSASPTTTLDKNSQNGFVWQKPLARNTLPPMFFWGDSPD